MKTIEACKKTHFSRLLAEVHPHADSQPRQAFLAATPRCEVVANLVENAVKYGAQTPVAVTLAVAGSSIVVRVRDGGPGIRDGDRARIFERFFRGDDRGEIAGSGLGLAIAEKAAARLGGTILLEDGRPGMTTFALTVPALVGLSGRIGEPVEGV